MGIPWLIWMTRANSGARSVADAVADYLLHHNANTHWNFSDECETDEALAEAGARG